MRVVLRVTSEAQSGRQVWLRPGQSIRVGRTEITEFAFPDDRALADEHFAIEFSADTCWLRDLNSDGTYLNGKRVLGRVRLSNGDAIVAGSKAFELVVEGMPAVKPAEDRADPQLAVEVFKERLIDYFRCLPDPLYAILDAAQDPLCLALLIQSDLQYQSLYQGIKGERLAAVAPYLVHLPPDSRLLETLIDKGWEKNWGIYLSCKNSFDEVRRQLRKFLLVETDAGKQVYFRYYDPRVLRVFLPTCSPREASDFFGPIRSYYCADEDLSCGLMFAAEHIGESKRIELATDPISKS